MTQQLKPCPFCGKLVIHMEINLASTGKGFLTIQCCVTMNEHYDFDPRSRHEQDKAKVRLIERWNKRNGAEGEK